MGGEKLKVIELEAGAGSHRCMDQEQIKKTEEKVKEWMADKQHRRCAKVALCAANAVVLMGLTAGVALLWMNELRRANRHHQWCKEGKSS